MKEYLKMEDAFSRKVDPITDWDEHGHEVKWITLLSHQAEHAAHAINSHDELVIKLDVAESTIYEVERVLSEMQRNGAFGLDDVIAEVECCIKRISE